MRRARAAALAAAVALAATTLAVTGAAAAVPTTAVTLELRPSSDAALRSLVVAHGLSRSERARRVDALVPDATRHRDVASITRELGLSVVSSTDWSMRVAGSTRAVTALFGTLSAPAAAVAGRAYPTVPSALQRYVVAALPTSGRVAKPLVSISPRTGSDFRTAYAAPPGSTGAGLAVATVQLSGWNSGDLATYAKHHNIPFDPTTQYHAVSVAKASTSKPDGQGGDEEVALDQEAILVSAPGATQVAYFAPNNDGGDGYVQAIQQVATDAKTYHTAALSLSWGGCEASDDRGWLSSMDQAMQVATAAGLTVFAASGDNGSLDCFGEVFGPAEQAPAVDYPAASPYAVAVGGTSLPPAGSTGSAVGWDGSGGGESTFEPLPSWQFSVASKSRSNHRLVPDIASDADPNNGLCIYESTTYEATDAACGKGSGEFMLGGTSLAAPTQAALLVDTLAANGRQGGIGDIHAALYQGAPAGAITDITADADPAGNGTYHSGTGYDLVTGLGTPVWTSLQSWLGEFDMGAPRGTRSLSFAIQPHASAQVTYSAWSPVLTTAPSDCSAATGSSPPTSVQLPADAADGTYRFWVAGTADTPTAGSCHIATAAVVLDRKAPSVAASVRVSGAGLATATWSFGDTAPSSGLRTFVVTALAGSRTMWTWTTTKRSRTFTALASARWHIRVTAYDNAGNAATATARLYDDSQLSYGAHWSRVTSRAAYRRSFEQASTVGATTRFTVTAKTIVLFVTRCSSCGVIGVLDARGHRLKTIDTYSSSTRYRVAVTIRALSAPAKQTLVLKVLRAKNRHSRGRFVGIDALTMA
jgi:hypothetical protein